MNKKLLVAAIASTLAAPAAFADTVIYGKLHVSIDSVDFDSGAYSGQAVTSRASRIGFKGSEDLGNGLKAVWKVESSVAVDSNPGLSGGRDAYLGMAGNFGTFLVAGRINTPFKNSTGKLDFFGDTLADYNDTVGFEDNRASNALVYISPKFSGLQFSGLIAAGESAANGNDGLADAYSLAVTYNNAGLMGALAYEKDDAADVFAKADTKYRVGLGYKMDAFKVAGLYEKQNDVGGSGSGVDANMWQISGAYSIGNNTLKAMYGENSTDGLTDKSGWAIGADHKMSKRTKVYALYVDSGQGLRLESSSSIAGGGHTRGEGFSVGMMHSF